MGWKSPPFGGAGLKCSTQPKLVEARRSVIFINLVFYFGIQILFNLI